jgi:hypothetical protein
MPQLKFERDRPEKELHRPGILHLEDLIGVRDIIAAQPNPPGCPYCRYRPKPRR